MLQNSIILLKKRSCTKRLFRASNINLSNTLYVLHHSHIRIRSICIKPSSSQGPISPTRKEISCIACVYQCVLYIKGNIAQMNTFADGCRSLAGQTECIGLFSFRESVVEVNILLARSYCRLTRIYICFVQFASLWAGRGWVI